MDFYTLNPLLDPRWDEMVASHPRASIFHTTGWLRALARTYEYRPVVVTSSLPNQPLRDGIAFCEINSWVTGSRLVSLPFADHAEPLLSDEVDLLALCEWIRTKSARHGWKYVELRPVTARPEWSASFNASQSFWLHTFSLAPSIEQLFLNLHKNCVQRRIRHAEHENLEYERGASDRLIHDFYHLLVITRKRHKLLPQPQSWFKNLIAEMGPNAEIRVARKDGVPVAAIFTLRHRNAVVYKYGCSDHRFHHLAGMPFLFWKFIEESRAEGAEEIDFGRTDTDNTSLAEFKDRLGSTRTRISYLRYPGSVKTTLVQSASHTQVGNLFALLPSAISSGMGRLIYRHIG